MQYHNLRYNCCLYLDTTGPDSDYGPNAACPDMSPEQMIAASEDFLAKLQENVCSVEQRDQLEVQTRGQHLNSKWREIRRNYLTASNFGAVINRRNKTPCHNLVKSILYRGDINTAAITYGRINEKLAIEKYAAIQNVTVQPCGIFVDLDHPYLGASPDGVITDQDGLVEVKCLPGIGKRKFQESAASSTCFEIINGNVRYTTCVTTHVL